MNEDPAVYGLTDPMNPCHQADKCLLDYRCMAYRICLGAETAIAENIDEGYDRSMTANQTTGFYTRDDVIAELEGAGYGPIRAREILQAATDNGLFVDFEISVLRWHGGFKIHIA